MKCYQAVPLESILYLVASVLSSIGSLLVIIMILSKNLFKTYSFKILLLISINDLFRGGFGICLYFFQSSENFCMFLGFIFGAVSMSNYLWGLCLTYTIYLIVVKEEVDFTKHHKKWLLISYLVPVLIMGLPLITQSYGLRNGFCELKDDKLGIMWRFLVYHPEVFAILVLNLIFSIKIYKKIREIGRYSLSSIIFERGLIYSIIIAIVDLPTLALRIIEISYFSCILLYLLICFLFLFLLQGFANSIVFFFNKSVKKIFLDIEFYRFGRSVSEIEDGDRLDRSDVEDSLVISFRSTLV